MVARVVAPSTAAALRPAPAGAAPVRAYSRKYGQRDRPRPYHKQKRRSKMLTATPDHDFQRNGKPYKDSNDPRLLRAHNNQALRTAKKTCFAEQLAAFEEAAAGFANPPELHFATMLERPPIITADEMPWETAFRTIRDSRRAAEKPETPAELERMLEDLKAEALEAQRRKREAALSGGGVNTSDDAGPAHEAGPGTTKDRRKAKEAAETESKYGADDLERRASALRGEGGAASQFVASSTREVPRITKNDELGNTRTLDRAFADRLVLVVREAATGRWVFPGAAFDHAASLTADPVLSPHGFKLSPLAAAVHRSTTAAFGQDLNFWVVGSSPMAVHLQPFDEEEQSRRQSYGKKVFLFRADILDGRVEMPDQFDDHQWLTRLEIQKAGLFTDEGFAAVAHDALGCSEQEFVHLAGCEPTASGRPSQAAVDEAAADILRLRGVGLDSAAAVAGGADAGAEA